MLKWRNLVTLQWWWCTIFSEFQRSSWTCCQSIRCHHCNTSVHQLPWSIYLSITIIKHFYLSDGNIITLLYISWFYCKVFAKNIWWLHRKLFATKFRSAHMELSFDSASIGALIEFSTALSRKNLTKAKSWSMFAPQKCKEFVSLKGFGT